jgi:chitodextrinase
MNQKSNARRVLTTTFLLALFSVFGIGKAVAAIYFSSPSGSGTTCSNSSPCSLTTGLGKTFAGDTLYLKDGTYNQSLTITRSGTSSAFITIKAQNDGKATIITNSGAPACFINGKSYINLEGLICEGQGSTYYNAVNIEGGSSYINVRRVSSYNKSGEDGAGFNVYQSSYVLLEDCASTGNNRREFNVLSSTHVTLRRCWAAFDNYLGTGSQGDLGTLTIYGSNNNIVENCVVTKTPSASGTIHGIHNWTNATTADNNSYYGNIAYGLTDWGYTVNRGADSIESENNTFVNNVSIENLRGFTQRADTNLTVTNLTIVGSTDSSVGAFTLDASTGVSGIIGSVTNSSIYNTAGYGFYRADSTLNHRYNNLYANSLRNYYGTSAGVEEININPPYDNATYGKGAYLMIPSALLGKGEGGANIGAEVLYRYQDGTLTSTPLWPWPMEDRIYRETGISVTWESKGGLWKTLDGIYAAQGDTTPPSKPADLAASAVSSSQINLSWTASTDNVGVAGYRIYRGGSLIGTTQSTSYFSTGLTASTSYTYMVAAYDLAGNVSLVSASASATTMAAVDTTPPSTPTGFIAAAASSSQINLSWAGSTDNVGVTGYKLSRNGNIIATTTAARTTYSDVGLAASTIYAYTVAAFDAAGNVSPQSARVSATTQVASGSTTTTIEVIVDDGTSGTDTAAPSKPTGLTAIATSSSQINLSWAASADNVGVAGYRVYRNGALIATTHSTAYSNTGLSASTSYTYTVAAYDVAGNVSAVSASATATTMADVVHSNRKWQSRPGSLKKK